MFKKILPIIVVICLIGLFFRPQSNNSYNAGGQAKTLFGTISYPTTLDTSSTIPNLISIKAFGLLHLGTCQRICFEPTHDFICHPVMQVAPLEVLLHIVCCTYSVDTS